MEIGKIEIEISKERGYTLSVKTPEFDIDNLQLEPEEIKKIITVVLAVLDEKLKTIKFNPSELN